MKVMRRNAETITIPDTRYNIYCPKMLNGLCGICAVNLAQAFQCAGYPAEPVIGTYLYRAKYFEPRHYIHCWVELNGKVYDITATQFGEAKIVIAESEDPYFRQRVADCWEGWSDAQTPQPWHREILFRGIEKCLQKN